MSEKMQKEKLRVKREYESRFKSIMLNKTQAEKEEALTGTLYNLKNTLTLTTAQVAEIEQRIAIAAKFSLLDGKLAYDGVVCNEEVS